MFEMDDKSTGADSPGGVEDLVAGAVEVKEEAHEALTDAALKVAEEAPEPKKQELRRMGGLRALDASVLLMVNRLPHNEESDRTLSVVSDLGRGLGWFALAGWLAWKGGPRGRRAAAATLAGMLISTGLTQGPIKHRFLRRRPFHDVRDHIVVGKKELDTSFPSGHTAGSFGAAMALSSLYPANAWPAFLVASLVGLSRIYLGQHYPSDVVGGAALGVAVGTVTGQVARRV